MPRHPKPANNNIPQRPAEFDRQIAAYYPALLNRARKYTRNHVVFANDTVVAALQRWQSFRQVEPGSYVGFWAWLSWVMRSVASDFKYRMSRTLPSGFADTSRERHVNGAQEATYDLGVVLMPLSARERDVLLRRAAGDRLGEIAHDMGISRQRVSQIEQTGRALVRAKAGIAENDNVRRAA